MVGYIKPDRRQLPRELRTEYQRVYCTLCRALRHDYALPGVAVLNHEVTLLLLLILGLAESEQPGRKGCCSISPLRIVPLMDEQAPWFRQAAQVSVYIAWGEIQDNVRDEGTLPWKLLACLADLGRKRADQLLPEEGAQCLTALEAYRQTEASAKTLEEVLALCSTMIVGLLDPLTQCAPRAWHEELRRLLRAASEWICLADACDDYHADRRKNRPNMLATEADPASASRAALAQRQGIIRDSLRRLPLKRYRPLLEHLLVQNLSAQSEKVLTKLQCAEEP